MSIAGCETSAFPVLADVRRPVLDRGVEARRTRLRVVPADARKVPARAVGGEVGDADEVNAGRARDLRQVHRAELAGADEADADRLPVGLAPQQLLVQAHWEASALRAAVFALGAARRLITMLVRPSTSQCHVGFWDLG